MRHLKFSPGQARAWRAPALALIVVAVGVGWLALGGEGALRYTGVARVELPLPSPVTPPAIIPAPPYEGQAPARGARHQADGIAAAAVDPSLIFDVPAEQMWEAAIRRLGSDPSAFQTSTGVH